MNTKNKLLWMILFVLIAGATIWTLTSQNRSFSFAAFRAYLQEMNSGWLAAAAASAFGFIFFEGAAVASASRSFGYPAGPGRGLVYSASDIYFSAITPSATGGQPACAYFMVKDGQPGTVAAAILLANLTMYTLSILLIGLVVFCCFPGIFLSLSPLSKTLILAGYAVQLAFTAFFVLLLLSFACWLRLLRHKEERLAKLERTMAHYGETVLALQGKPRMLVKLFFLNLLQRLSSIFVPVFVYLASGGQFRSAPLLLAIQCYVITGSNCIPIPGAMGVSDYLMLDAFGTIMTPEQSANLELLSRSLSFYLCVILCGIITLAAFLIQKRKEHLSC